MVRAVTLAGALGALLLAAQNVGATPEVDLIPRWRLFAEPDKAQVQLSPDGTRVGYITSRDGLRQLWIVEVTKPTTIRRISGDTTVITWRWTYTNRHILVESPTQRGRRVTIVDLETGTRRDLAGGKNVNALFVKLSPRHPEDVVVSLRGRGDDRDGLYRFTFAGGEGEKLLADEGFDRWFLDPEFRVRAGRKPVGEGYFLYRYSVADGWSPIADWDEPRLTRLAGVVSLEADGRRLTVVENTDRDKAAAVTIDLETGERTTVCEDPLADLLWVGGSVHPRTGRVEALVSYFVRLRRHFLEPSIEIDFEFLKSAQPGDVSHVGRSLDDHTWLVRYMNGGPFVYFVYDRRQKTLRRLFSDLPALDSCVLASRRALILPARDGLTLPCDLYLPPGSDQNGDGRPDQPLPTVLYVHGGPWVGFEWNSWFTNRSFQLLANRGYAVVRTDFRGARGYGRRFMDAGDQEFGGRMHEDLLDIAKACIARHIADPQRIGIWGWSFGGYATNAALALSPDTFACGISMYGLSDLVEFISGLEGSGRELWNRRVGDPGTEDGLAKLRRHSPLFHAQRVRRPILVTHGALDRRAPKAQSDGFVEALAAHEKTVTYLVYPDEPHDYRNAASWRSFWAVGERFLSEHLGGRCEPYGECLARANLQGVHGLENIPGLAAKLVE